MPNAYSGLINYCQVAKKEAYGESKLICLALSSQYPLIGIGIPRKLTVPTTLLSTMESMVSIPLIMDLPAIEASIPIRMERGY